MWTEAWIGVAIAVMAMVVGGWTAMRFTRRRGTETPAWLPEQLRGAALAYVERSFRTVESPFLVARVDRAYRGKNGLITLVELKTRDEVRVHASDIIELSAQRLALSSETGVRVSTIAFVVVESDGRREALPVRLLATGEVQALAQRREDLASGRILPRPPSNSGLCAGCRWRARCRPDLQPELAGSRGVSVPTARNAISLSRGRGRRR